MDSTAIIEAFVRDAEQLRARVQRLERRSVRQRLSIVLGWLLATGATVIAVLPYTDAGVHLRVGSLTLVDHDGSSRAKLELDTGDVSFQLLDGDGSVLAAIEERMDGCEFVLADTNGRVLVEQSAMRNMGIVTVNGLDGQKAVQLRNTRSGGRICLHDEKNIEVMLLATDESGTMAMFNHEDGPGLMVGVDTDGESVWLDRDTYQESGEEESSADSAPEPKASPRY